MTKKDTIEQIAKLARRLTGALIYRKRLPAEIGRASILVTSRSDIRLLAPGWDWAAGDLMHVVARYVNEGDVVWDIGSNLGIFSFSSALRSGHRGHVYSVEADPRYADIQSRTLARFPVNAARIDILCAAVADQIGMVDLLIPRKGHSRNHLAQVEGNSPGEAESCKPVVTVTLDWLLERWRVPEFIKIDVEGAEVLTVNGADRFFSEARPSGYIECAERNSRYLTEYFLARGYRLFAITELGEEMEVERFVFNTVIKPAEKC